ncbi:MAG: nucleotidyltransferase, partial [Alphaproteobacteria bacterium]|nr:nucleotidyltransferase [Alphaproteobacteria bacterium]
MKPSEALERHRADIRRIVEANRACNPRVFGSVLHGED